MAVGAGGLLGGAAGGIGGAISSMAATGLDAVKFTVEQGGKVVKAVRDDKTEIEIPSWMLGKKNADPVKIPGVLFGYLALGLGIYVLARALGIRPFDWLITAVENAKNEAVVGFSKTVGADVQSSEIRAGIADIDEKIATLERMLIDPPEGTTRAQIQNGISMYKQQRAGLVAELSRRGESYP